MVTPIEVLSALANIATAAAVVVGAWQLVLSHRLSVTNFEDSFAREYRALAATLPIKALLGEPLADDEHVKYFDEMYQPLAEMVLHQGTKSVVYVQTVTQ
jgi:hypothetical protein